MNSFNRLGLLIHLSGVEGGFGSGEREHRPFSMALCLDWYPRELCKYGFDSSGKVSILPLKQTNK